MKKENKTKEKDVVPTTYEEKTKKETKKNDNPITLVELSSIELCRTHRTHRTLRTLSTVSTLS